jgi:hypothetical protein
MDLNHERNKDDFLIYFCKARQQAESLISDEKEKNQVLSYLFFK